MSLAKLSLLLLVLSSSALAGVQSLSISGGSGGGGTGDASAANQTAQTTKLTAIQVGTDRIPVSPAQDRTTAAAPSSCRISDGSSFLDPRQVTVQNASITVTGPATDAQMRASPLPISINQTGTANDVDANVSGSVTANLGTLNGAATSAKQDTGNTSLGSIDTKLTSQATATLQGTTNTKLDTINTTLGTPAQDRTTAGAPMAVKLVNTSGAFYDAGGGSGGGNEAASATGAAVPAKASYSGFNLGGNLVGVSAANPLPTSATISGTPNVAVTSSTLPTGAATETTLSSLNGKVTAVNTGATVVSSSVLPTGAATSAKQPALGTAGTPSADVLTVQGAASMVAIKVDGSGVTQPMSAAALPLPSGASTEATLSALNGKVTACNTGATVVSSSALPSGASTEATLSAMSAKLPATLGQKTMSASQAVVIASDQSSLPATLQVAAAASSTPVGSVSLGNSLGKTNVMRVGTLASSAATADQVILTYTVTAGKTLYITYFACNARLTTFAATATLFGTCSIESPAATKLLTTMLAGSGIGDRDWLMFSEPIPIAAGTVIRVVTTPSAATAMTWQANLGGYEK